MALDSRDSGRWLCRILVAFVLAFVVPVLVLIGLAKLVVLSGGYAVSNEKDVLARIAPVGVISRADSTPDTD